jgi:tetratricopeptide (TPR) repeat protein
MDNAETINKAIIGCTQFIQSGGNGDAYDLSQAYEYRGAYYKYQGNRDLAIADFRAALKLFPMNCPPNRAEAAGACGGLMDLGVTP